VKELPPCANPKAFSPDGSLLVIDGRVACTGDTGVQTFEASPDADLSSRVISLPSGNEVLDLGPRVVAEADFNPAGTFPGGRYLAINVFGDEARAIEIHDMTTGTLVASHDLAPDQVFAASFDPSGRWLAIGSSNGTVAVLDMTAVVDGATPDDALVFNRVTHQTPAPYPIITADGILATRGYGDSFVRLWDIETGEMTVELRADPNVGFPMQFTPDGRYLYYQDTGYVLRRYPTDIDELIELAESRLTRDFTADECRRYLGTDDCP
jgi:WD40 repeat protein